MKQLLEHQRTSSKSKHSDPRKSTREIFVTLPFTDPIKKGICGEYVVGHNYAHQSRIRDLENPVGITEYSAHVEQGHRQDCGDWRCSYCNFVHDENGNVVYDYHGHRKPNGIYLHTIEEHTDKLEQMRTQIRMIIEGYGGGDASIRELKKFFFSNHKTNHTNRDVFYTLVDKKMGPKQRQNLIKTIIYAVKHKTGFGVYHSVISLDPSASFKTEGELVRLTDNAIDDFREIGLFGGYIYFHPFRIPDEFNDRDMSVIGPHFHFVGFGHIMKDVQGSVSARDNVIVKMLHYDNGKSGDGNGHVEPVKSIRQTIAYNLSHVGIMQFKDKIEYEIDLLEQYHKIDNQTSEAFTLPHRISNFETTDGEPPRNDQCTFVRLTEMNTPSMSLYCRTTFILTQKIPTADLGVLLSNSLDYHNFLKSPQGQEITLLRRNLFNILEGADRDHYMSIEKSNKGKKNVRGVFRNFGIISNSKNFIWHYVKPPKQKYCAGCDMRIPLSEMFPVHVLTDSLIGVKGPPDDQLDDTKNDTKNGWTVGDELLADLAMTQMEQRKEKNELYKILGIGGTEHYNSEPDLSLKVIPPQDILDYYPPIMDSHDNPTDMCRVPLNRIERLDIDVVRYRYRQII